MNLERKDIIDYYLIVLSTTSNLSSWSSVAEISNDASIEAMAMNMIC